MKNLIIDTETTGLGPCDIIEVAYIPFHTDIATEIYKYKVSKTYDELWNHYEVFHQQYKPDRPIHPEASKIHGKYNKDLWNKPHHSTFNLPKDCKLLIGHNIRFDYRALGKPNVKLVCTMDIAKKLWTDRPKKGGYTLEGLITYLYPDEPKLIERKFHSALQDVQLCYLVLIKILEQLDKVDSIEELVKLTSQGKK